ncbi:DUF3298 domain-containing protein, partial [Clostridium botulinum]|nr:DUF3298 domain-containing protein [Clostridium botulinum]
MNFMPFDNYNMCKFCYLNRYNQNMNNNFRV